MRPETRVTVGVIGGGQLAWMLAPAARHLGLQLRVLASSEQEPALRVIPESVLGDLSDPARIRQLAQGTQVITFENEFVDLDRLRPLLAEGVRFRPSLESLAPLLDKYTQRLHLQAQGLPVPQFQSWDLGQETAGLEKLGWPLVLKARRQGYDGRGTQIVPHAQDLEAAWTHLGSVPVLVEQFVPFRKELAVMVARSPSGEIAVHPVVETEQDNQVCRRVIAPARVPLAVQLQVEQIAHQIVSSLDGMGIFGVELFWVPQWQNPVLINEIAPRPHNSGHFSIEACVTSQFEQHLRAIAGLPLGDPSLKASAAVMVNLLGYESITNEYLQARQRLSELPGAHLHWYGKTEARPGRKLGHITLLGENLEAVLTLADQAEAIWRRQA